jgi:hypothetical protein
MFDFGVCSLAAARLICPTLFSISCRPAVRRTGKKHHTNQTNDLPHRKD